MILVPENRSRDPGRPRSKESVRYRVIRDNRTGFGRTRLRNLGSSDGRGIQIVEIRDSGMHCASTVTNPGPLPGTAAPWAPLLKRWLCCQLSPPSASSNTDRVPLSLSTSPEQSKITSVSYLRKEEKKEPVPPASLNLFSSTGFLPLNSQSFQEWFVFD